MRSRSMRTVLGFAGLLLFTGLAQPISGQETQDTAQLAESLRSARTSMSAAFAKLDAAAAAGHFADDGAVDFQGQTVAGKAAVGGWFAEVFSGLSSLRSGTATFVIADGQVTERSSYVVGTPDGDQQGSTETVWKRQGDGTWKVARMTVM